MSLPFGGRISRFRDGILYLRPRILISRRVWKVLLPLGFSRHRNQLVEIAPLKRYKRAGITASPSLCQHRKPHFPWSLFSVTRTYYYPVIHGAWKARLEAFASAEFARSRITPEYYAKGFDPRAPFVMLAKTKIHSWHDIIGYQYTLSTVP